MRKLIQWVITALVLTSCMPSRFDGTPEFVAKATAAGMRWVKASNGGIRFDPRAADCDGETFNCLRTADASELQQGDDNEILGRGSALNRMVRVKKDRGETSHVLTHEIGHSLGLFHTTAKTVMHPHTGAKDCIGEPELFQLCTIQGRCNGPGVPEDGCEAEPGWGYLVDIEGRDQPLLVTPEQLRSAWETGLDIVGALGL